MAITVNMASMENTENTVPMEIMARAASKQMIRRGMSRLF